MQLQFVVIACNGPCRVCHVCRVDAFAFLAGGSGILSVPPGIVLDLNSAENQVVDLQADILVPHQLVVAEGRIEIHRHVGVPVELLGIADASLQACHVVVQMALEELRVLDAADGSAGSGTGSGTDTREVPRLGGANLAILSLKVRTVLVGLPVHEVALAVIGCIVL